MKLKRLGPNQAELEVETVVVFFSYSTPVAARIDASLYRTKERFSVTTTKHINTWLAGREAEPVAQNTLDRLLVAAKGGVK